MVPKPKVLVVDDEELNLDTFRRVFRKDLCMHLEVSPLAALAAAGREYFDIALVDYSMPEMNGVEFLTRLKAQNPNVDRVLVTAHIDLPDVRDASTSGLSTAVIMKPWNKDDILGWIDRLMKKDP